MGLQIWGTTTDFLYMNLLFSLFKESQVGNIKVLIEIFFSIEFLKLFKWLTHLWIRALVSIKTPLSLELDSSFVDWLTSSHTKFTQYFIILFTVSINLAATYIIY